MESFVLNLFSDQLSKIILNFHQSQINANFLSGKGSITNVKLNVGLINDFLNKPPHGTVPFLEFQEIKLTELRVEVTSYTNLKKAPIVLVIEEIHAIAREPLEYHVDPAKGNNAGKSNAPAAKPPSPPRKNSAQQYGLLHRILDNLSVKIKRIHLSFSSLGKFKTRRIGPWMPPTLQVCLDNVEWISVTETGNPGTPDQVWEHNELGQQQSMFKRESMNQQQHRHRTYTIYKRLSMLCHVNLLPLGGQKQGNGGPIFGAKASSTADEQQQAVSTLFSDTKVDVHVAYTRRLRDAGVTGADMDVQVHGVDINLDVAAYNDRATASTGGCDLGAFVHMLVGLLHCYYKDRSFVDPLLLEGVRTSLMGGSENVGMLRGFSHSDAKDDEEEEAGPDNFLPEVAVMDEDSESSDSDYEEDPDVEHDEAFLAWKREQDQKDGGALVMSDSGDDKQSESLGDLPIDVGQEDGLTTKEGNKDLDAGASEENRRDQATPKSYKRKRKAVIVIASGAQKFEKLSFSLSIPRINMKVCLPPSETADDTNVGNYEGGDSVANRHCLELLLEGLVAECIWPKNKMGEMGGHVQGSIRYFHAFESEYQHQKDWGNDDGAFGPKPANVLKISPLLRIGTRMFQAHDSFSLSPHLAASRDSDNGASKCDVFPLLEKRETTWKWDRQTKGPRALAFKSTISFVDEVSVCCSWSPPFLCCSDF